MFELQDASNVSQQRVGALRNLKRQPQICDRISIGGIRVPRVFWGETTRQGLNKRIACHALILMGDWCVFEAIGDDTVQVKTRAR